MIPPSIIRVGQLMKVERKQMLRILMFPLLLLFACLLAGIYGAIHDQVSYSISSEYFTAYKFKQFDISEGLQNRVGVALVGWYASWWMGIFIGLPILIVGLIFDDWRLYRRYCLWAFAVVAGTTFLFGFFDFILVDYAINESTLPRYVFPPEVVNRLGFAKVGTLHNSSYCGGFVGILTGSLYLILKRVEIVRKYPCIPKDIE